MTKREINDAKKYVQYEFFNKYGFYPPLSWIEIDEEESTMQFVDFHVRGHRYTYDGLTMKRHTF